MAGEFLTGKAWDLGKKHAKILFDNIIGKKIATRNNAISQGNMPGAITLGKFTRSNARENSWQNTFCICQKQHC